MNIFRTRTRRGAAILFSGILVLGGFALTSEASAGRVVEGNPTCPVGYEFTEKQESPSGTYTFNRAGVTATITVGTSYDQEGVAAPNNNNAITSYSVPGTDYRIIVKGGNGAIIYSTGESTPLHAPANESGKWPTISHFQLCWNTPAPEPEVGQLEVEKVVVGTDTPKKYTFEICVAPVEAEGTPVCKEVEGNGTLKFKSLPPGDYVVTETDPGPRFSVEGSGVTVTVESEDTTETTVTNTWIPPDKTFGEIELTKEVTGESVPAGAKFTICIQGPAPSTTTICESFKAAETVTFDDLAPGTYKVTETNPGTAYTVTITPSDTPEVTAGEVTQVTVTNTYKAPPNPPPPEEEVVPPTQEALPPTAPVTPTTAVAPTAPTTPAQVSAQALPTTGSEGGLAAIAAILVTTGVGLTLLGKRRGTQRA